MSELPRLPVLELDPLPGIEKFNRSEGPAGQGRGGGSVGNRKEEEQEKKKETGVRTCCP